MYKDVIMRHKRENKKIHKLVEEEQNQKKAMERKYKELTRHVCMYACICLFSRWCVCLFCVDLFICSACWSFPSFPPV